MRRNPVTLLSFFLLVAAQAAACAREESAQARGTDRRVTAATDSEIPAGPLGASIRRGRALMLATRDSLPGQVGNSLRCVSCHLDEGRRENGSWVGVFARYPQYRSRSNSVETLEFRVNDCFRRSMNGKPLPADGRDMEDIVAYFAFLSRGTAVGPPEPRPSRLKRFERLTPDTAAGAAIFGTMCAKCHGPGGQGTPVGPPVWGPPSYSIGAGMARVRTAASFIRDNMPFDLPGSLTDQQALDVAAFVNNQPRPDYPGKEYDWPLGDAPPDAAYPTLGAQKKARAAH